MKGRANRAKKLHRFDPVNPSHYRSHPSGVQCYEIAQWWSFHCGCALRYLWRVDGKGDPVENLRKAAWHIEKEILRRKRIAIRSSDKVGGVGGHEDKTIDHQEELIFDNCGVTEEMEFERVHKDQPCSFCRGRLRLADCVAARVFEYTETASSKE